MDILLEVDKLVPMSSNEACLRKSEKVLEEKEYEGGFGDVSGAPHLQGSERSGKAPGLFPRTRDTSQWSRPPNPRVQLLS